MDDGELIKTDAIYSPAQGFLGWDGHARTANSGNTITCINNKDIDLEQFLEIKMFPIPNMQLIYW